MRYFFDMATNRTRLHDENGKEFRELSEAHEHAVHLIHRAMAYLSDGDTDGWMVKIGTAEGTVPLTVLFPKRFVGSRTASDDARGSIRSRGQ